jgi:hypothetical protein
MFKTLKRISPAARWITVVVSLALMPAPLPAQFYGPLPGQYRAPLRAAPPTLFLQGNRPYAPIIRSPVGEYLSAQADIITSGGQYRMNTQEANLMQEQLKQNRIDTRRKALEQDIYEKSMTPTPAALREEKRLEQVRYYRDTPALNDIYSGIALNCILQDIQKIERETGLRGPSVTIDEEVLKQINVSGGKAADDGAVAGVLRDGTVHWPLSLQGAKFKKAREQIDSLVPKLIRQALSGAVDRDDLAEARKAATTIRDELTYIISDIGVSEYVSSSEYLRQLESSLKIFAGPNPANFFNGVMTAKGKTIGELVDSMGRNGLTFVRAAPGDERAYTVIQRSLATYDIQLQDLARRSMVAAPPPR